MARTLLHVALVLLVSGCADLVVTSVHDAPFTGPLLMMKAKVKNDGWRAAPASTTSLEYKTPSSAFTQAATRPTPPLATGQEVELDMWPFHLSALVPVGQCIDVRVCADSAGVVWEGWLFEGNNCRTRTFCRN